MGSPDLCTEEEIRELVTRFYARVRADADLGPIFERHVSDWDAHHAQLIDFWSSVLRGTARYRGTPMPKHAALDELSPARFHRWLALFAETTAELGNTGLRERATEMAQRIAQSLWHGHQMSRERGRISEPLAVRDL
ncbi:group III truncated hemoglobin [Chitinasiproducens palmae]|uniref:Hemoglobin n=1 Tax=Chitinasiproducens palmae TaxID=1770053 RepID=A0A1H2PRF2_9BURK|nr:group III truncated hemoglobin [Chitinasiproducens palmae]SDV49051.1 hemoglobin [Chitinasiproducens palmae]